MTNEITEHGLDKLYSMGNGNYYTKEKGLMKSISSVWIDNKQSVFPVKYDNTAKDYYITIRYGNKPTKVPLWKVIQENDVFLVRNY